MGMEIDRVNTSHPRISIATVRATLENVRSLLKLFEEFDDAVRNLDIIRCCDSFLTSFKKTLDTFGDEFNDDEFLDNYITTPLDAYTVFECLYKDDDYLTNSLSQYAGQNIAFDLNLESAATRSRNFKDIYESVMKEGRVYDGGELAERLMREFYKRFEVLVKVLYHLSYKSFQFLTIGAGTTLTLTLSPTVTREVKLSHVLECYNDLGLFGYFVQLFETFCESFLKFRMPQATAATAAALSKQFNVNLHLRNFSRDREFSESLVRDIRSGLYLTNQRLLLVDKYLKYVSLTYSTFDITDDFQLNMFVFESNLSDVLFSRLVTTYYEDLCDNLSPLLSVVDCVDVVECLRDILEKNYPNLEIKYMETYLNTSMSSWDNRFLHYVRYLSMNQCVLGNKGFSEGNGQGAHELKLVSAKTVPEIHQAFMGQFFASCNIKSENSDVLLHQIHRRLMLLCDIQNCGISNNLHKIAVIMIRLAMAPIALDHELTQYLTEDERYSGKIEGVDGLNGLELGKMTKNEIMELLVERNANLMHNGMLMYTISTENSVNEFLESVPEKARDPKNLEGILLTFIIYVSNYYYISNLAIVLPYLMQSTLNLVYSLRSGTAFQFSGDCDQDENDCRGQILKLIRRNYKTSISRVPILKAMDFVIVHMCCFSQQYVSKLVCEALESAGEPSGKSRAADVVQFFTLFKELTYKYLPVRTALTLLSIIVDLTYRDLMVRVLEFFEEMNYKFNRQVFARVCEFVEEVEYALSSDILKGMSFNFNNGEKFANFMRIFRGEPERVEAVFTKEEQSRVSKLARQVQLLM